MKPKSNDSSKLALALVVALVAGCSSSPQMGRIDANRAVYEQWPIEIRQAVLDGRVEAGMTPDMVTVALGKPVEVHTRDDPAGTGRDVIWIFRPVVFPDDNNGRGHVVGPGPPIGSTLPPEHTPIEDREIVFHNGVVVRADPLPEK